MKCTTWETRLVVRFTAKCCWIWRRTPGAPYNYPWTEDFSAGDSDLLAATLKEYPHLTPYFLAASTIEAMVVAEQRAAMNLTARDLLLYIKPTTMLSP